MLDFWKNEWSLFKVDVGNVKNFLTQPVEITLWGKSDLMLKPSVQEIQEKGDVIEASGFWSNEWKLFLKDLNDAKDFFVQPISFK